MEQMVVDNRYALVKPLGSGGMAKVYLAHDEVLGRDVALKMLRGAYAEDDEFVERFKREAQAAAKLSHPNIVAVYDRGRAEDGSYYIAMEYVPGGTLKDRIVRDGALAPGVSAGVAEQIADALSAAHEQGVIHRDIKPQNALVTRSGDVKVTDFGIARAAASPSVTATSVVLGTAAYMSPEQAQGKPVGPASDLYSLGVVLYEMLTGALPFEAENPVAVSLKHINEPAPSPREANPEVPEALDAITCRLLAKDPRDRYPNASALADDLDRIQSGLAPTVVAAEKTKLMAAPLPPLPKDRTRREAKTAVAPAPYAPPTERRRGGGILRLLAPLFVGVALIAGVAYALTTDWGTSENAGTNKNAPAENPPPARQVEVPNVTGQDQGQAETALQRDGLTANVQNRESTFDEQGIVLEQSPGAGERADEGSEVTIVVGSGPANVTVPDLGYEGTAAADLEYAGLVLGAVSYEATDGYEPGLILSQDPAVGEPVPPGTAVNIVVASAPTQPAAAPSQPTSPAPSTGTGSDQPAGGGNQGQGNQGQGSQGQGQDGQSQGGQGQGGQGQPGNGNLPGFDNGGLPGFGNGGEGDQSGGENGGNGGGED